MPEIPDNLKDKIPLLIFVGLTPAQDAAFRAEAARAGISPMEYLYHLVQTEPGRFIVPLPSAPRLEGFEPPRPLPAAPCVASAQARP